MQTKKNSKKVKLPKKWKKMIENLKKNDEVINNKKLRKNQREIKDETRKKMLF